MELQQIRYFLELSKQLHFWNTAGKMAITQSALSRQIKALEEELGVQLFERNKRNVKLTAAGSFLQQQWLRLLPEIEGLNRHAKQIQAGKAGSVTIGYPGSIAYGFLPALMTAISKHLPDLKVELVEPEDIDFEDLLLHYQMDLALRRDSAKSPALQSEMLYAEPFALVVPENHVLTQENYRGLEQLTEAKFILSGLHHSTFYGESLRQIFSSHNFTPAVTIESDYGATVLSLVAKGLGVTILPGSYAFSAKAGVRFITLPHETRLYANWRKDDTNPALQNVLALVQQVAREFAEQYPSRI